MSVYIRRAQRPDSAGRRSIKVAQRASGVAESALRRAATPLARKGFPYRKPTAPRSVEVPKEPSKLGGAYDTEWARSPLARAARGVIVEGPMRLAVRTLTSPKVHGLDRLSDLERAAGDDESPAPVIFAPNHHSHFDTGLMIRSIPAARYPVPNLSSMEEFIIDLLQPRTTAVLLVVIGVSLAVLAKLADIVVDQAVVLSERSNIPKVVIGATVVSLGTTAPEVAVSVFAAFKGNPGLAMGNAVGSIICDTGLILGIACLIQPLTIPSRIANRQGWVQLGSGLLLVLMSLPWASPLSPWTEEAEGTFPRWAGCLFLVLLAIYLVFSVKWSRLKVNDDAGEGVAEESSGPEDVVPTSVTLLKLMNHLLN